MEDKFTLDSFQEEAISYSHKDHSIIVSAPTGAGKTLIAEYIMNDCIQNQRGVIYTAPIKALSNQKYRDFSKKYPALTGIVTGDVSINPTAPILIMTTEIFRNALLIEPESYKYRQWVIFDEIHYLDDIERGTVWEETIILLPEHMKMLALSATIPNINEFTNWLANVHYWPIKVITEKNRPVPLHFFFQANNDFSTDFNQLKSSNILQPVFNKNNFYQKKFKNYQQYPIGKANRLSTLLDYLKKNDMYPCIYFSFSRRRCEDLAQETSHYNFLNPQEKEIIQNLFDSLLDKFNVGSSPHIKSLSYLVTNGIAYHHAGLLPTVKEIIEQLFTSGLIKLIFTTETFALGINMPARTVVFDKLTKFYRFQHRYIKTRDFYQMAGRAGRRGIDKEGYVFSRLHPQDIDLVSLQNIIYGPYEPIKSQFNSCYATILNLYRVMGERILDIYPKSFHFHQSRPWEKKEVLGLFKRRIALLKNLNYISNNQLTEKAELASKVYSFELAVGTLFEEGFFELLEPKDLFILITALVYEPRKGEHKPKLTKPIKKIKQQLDIFIKDIHRQEKNFQIFPLSKNFYFHLSFACTRWFEKEEFSRLTKFCAVDEGEIVRYFRMSIQVFRELLSCQAISPQLKDKLLYCFSIVNRDVIDAEKQLRQQI